MATVLITGGSGLIGRRLTLALRCDGHVVRWLGRAPSIPNEHRFHWDPTRGSIDRRALEGVDHIIHLSGAGIADKRWTQERMKELYSSRGGAARFLLKSTQELSAKPCSFISASGIGYYGAVTTDHLFREEDPAGDDAIGRLTKDWEDAADEWSSRCRVVKLRTPMVLAREGGALMRLSAPFRFGLGAALGSGKQWMPWIHIDDLVAAYTRAVGDADVRGAYNVVADEQPTNSYFMRAVAKALRRPCLLPNVPGIALRLALGELSVILLEGSRADNARTAGLGFRPTFNVLEAALDDTLNKR
jgi:uncharacterized protein